MATLWNEITIIIVLMLFNGIFAMSEFAIVSARKARLQQSANEGNSKAAIALELADTPGSFLSTIQVGITLIGILAGAYGEATIAAGLSVYLGKYSLLAPYRDTISFAIVVVIITYLSLIIGELVPKRIALNSPERIAMVMAKPMRALSWLAMPVVHLLKMSTNIVLSLLQIQPSKEPSVTEEEVKILIDQGARSGVFEEMEQDMVESIFRLGDKKVSAIMTPRPDMVSLDLDDSVEENWKRISDSGHSGFPVYKDSEDNVVGIVSIKVLWARMSAGQTTDLKTSLSKPLFVPESLPALKLLNILRQSDMHMALVVDEYGSVQGLVTPRDVFKAIVGDLAPGHELEESYAVRREDGSWLMDGMIPIDEFMEVLDIRSMPSEYEDQFNTLGGFILTQMGRIPDVADHFEWSGFRFEVVDMDGPRVDKVLVTYIEKPTS